MGLIGVKENVADYEPHYLKETEMLLEVYW